MSASTDSKTIILYDIPTKDESVGTWSPNTFKARLSLQLKGIPFKTEWVEYPDIEPLCKRIGALPTSKKEDGRDHYTLPTIFDPSTGRAVSDSLPIALYLDQTYPDSPGHSLIPNNTHVLQAVFNKWYYPAVVSKVLVPLLPRIVEFLPPRSSAYFRETREARFGAKLEDLAPIGSEKREQYWKEVEVVFGEIDGATTFNGAGKSFVMADTPSWADIAIAGTVLWVKIIGLPEDWERVKAWHGGRWVRLTNDLLAIAGAGESA